MSDTDAHQAFFKKVAGRGRSDASLRPTDDDLNDLRNYRHECRQDEGGGGMCHLVTHYAEKVYGWPKLAVTYLTLEGEVIFCGHYVNVLPDGSILDPTADQIGEGDDIRLCSPGDPTYCRYRMEWYEDYNPSSDEECAAIAAFYGIVWDGVLDGRMHNKNNNERGDGWWLTDKSHYASYEKKQLVYALTMEFVSWAISHNEGSTPQTEKGLEP